MDGYGERRREGPHGPGPEVAVAHGAIERAGPVRCRRGSSRLAAPSGHETGSARRCAQRPSGAPSSDATYVPVSRPAEDAGGKIEPALGRVPTGPCGSLPKASACTRQDPAGRPSGPPARRPRRCRAGRRLAGPSAERRRPMTSSTASDRDCQGDGLPAHDEVAHEVQEGVEIEPDDGDQTVRAVSEGNRVGLPTLGVSCSSVVGVCRRRHDRGRAGWLRGGATRTIRGMREPVVWGPSDGIPAFGPRGDGPDAVTSGGVGT